MSDSSATAALPPPEERKLLADTGKLSSATAASHVVNLAGGLIVAGILTPAAWGVWKYVQIIMLYTGFANFGATNGLDRSCPALVSKGKLSLYRRFLGASLAFSTLISVAIGTVFLVLGIVMPSGHWRTAFLALSVLVVLQPFFQHGEAALSSEKRFGAKATAIVGSTLVRIGASVAAAFFFGLAGVLAVFAFTLIVTTAYMFSRTDYGWPFQAFRQMRLHLPRGIIRVGLPITLLAFAEQIFLTTDKWIVGGVFGEAIGGFYLFAFFPLPVLLMVPSALRQIISIDVYDKYSRLRRIEPCRDVFERSVMAIALGSPVLIGAVYLGMPWIIEFLLEQYRPSIPTLKLHAIAVFPILISQTALPIVVITRRVKGVVMGYLAVTALAGAVSCWFLATVPGASMIGVVLIHGIAWGLFSAALMAITLVWLGDSVGWAAWRVVRWLIPMAYLAVELPALEWLLVRLGLTPHTFIYGAGGGVLHLLACAPFLWMLERRIKGVSFVLNSLARRLGKRA
ncbi:MAG: hypothetical protein PWP23_1759 [Candidatus Sumerlaeota bacterium]|nr:hypothetical protein [Candidatus Sumerlaeota bacterium]